MHTSFHIDYGANFVTILAFDATQLKFQSYIDSCKLGKRSVNE